VAHLARLLIKGNHSTEKIMSTYKELQNQIEKLQKEAEQARKTELSNAIADIHSKMREFSISAEDLGFGMRKRTMKSLRKPVAPKYKNNDTGETWSGRGKPPKWMAGRDKAQFRIHA
jgi:DNA-binding protein H-NS